MNLGQDLSKTWEKFQKLRNWDTKVQKRNWDTKVQKRNLGQVVQRKGISGLRTIFSLSQIDGVKMTQTSFEIDFVIFAYSNKPNFAENQTRNGQNIRETWSED